MRWCGKLWLFLWSVCGIFTRSIYVDNSDAINTLSPRSQHCWNGPYPPTPSEKVPTIPTYVIDLDLPPAYRYHKVMEDKGAQFYNLVQLVKTHTPFGAFGIIERLSGIISSCLPYPFNEEIRGIALGTGLDRGDVALANIFYEIVAFCTSIIARPSNGPLIHARNLDFGLAFGWDNGSDQWLLTEHLRPLTVQLDFRRRNQTVFHSTGFAGMIGVLTGVRPGDFALTTNKRFTSKPGIWYIIKWILGSQLQWNTVITRRVLENATSYSEALHRLATTPLIAPTYFILSSAVSDEGAVITRDQYAADIWKLGQESRWQSATWYLLQTNYDHWRRPPFYDDRRTAGIKCMDRLGSGNLTDAAVYSVLHTKPLLNKLTIYSSVMSAHDGRMDSWLQRCEESDCKPW